jgi:uncharacterized protein
MKTAIIGTGIAGMGSAWFLHRDFDITLFEQNNYAGGHTHTVYAVENGKRIPVDTGFMVFNNTTYPNLVKLFQVLGVETMPTDMSFSVQHVPTGLEYCGSGLNGLFAQRKNVFNRKFISMLLQINRFNVQSVRILDDPKFESYSLLDYAREFGYGDDFLYKYIAPMSSALWSTPTDITLKFPATALVRFFKNHGFLGLNTQFQWLTVKNGSWQYRDKLIAPFKDRIRVNTAVKKVFRENNAVTIFTEDGEAHFFDKVIFACHADEALRMLGDPTPLEQRLLEKFSYQKNVATLHTDTGIMPKIKSVWSSWNYRIDEKDGLLQPSTIYYMNKLQQVSRTKDYFVSINDPETVNPEKVIRRIDYHHPIFTTDAVKVQPDLHRLNDNGISYFCGSYFRYGFHEDAFTSAVDMCTRFTGKQAWETPSSVLQVESTRVRETLQL